MSRIKTSGLFGLVGRGPLALGKLRLRGDDEESFGGVCAGVAYWLGLPQWVIRVAMIAGLLWATAWALAVYAGLYMVLPTWKNLPRDFEQRTGGDED